MIDEKQQLNQYYNGLPPPQYVDDILAPSGVSVAGQLLPWSATTHTATNKYIIYGDDAQLLEVALVPGEMITAEVGSMAYRAPNISMQTGMGSLGGVAARALTGESMFKNTFTNVTNTLAGAAFTPSYPAKIIPIDLQRSGTIITMPGCYFAHLGQVMMNVTLNLRSGFLTGKGLLLQKISGSGIVFVTGGGTIMEKYLQPGEVLVCDSDCLVAYSETCNYSTELVKGCFTCCCGGEGLFLTTIAGPGLVIVASLSKRRLQLAITPNAPATSVQ